MMLQETTKELIDCTPINETIIKGNFCEADIGTCVCSKKNDAGEQTKEDFRGKLQEEGEQIYIW